MEEGIILRVQDILDQEGWHYIKTENDILMLVSFRNRKWKMVISCEGDRGVCCFSVYPWPLTEDRLAGALAAINDLNLARQRGCFMINPKDRSVVYRCGIQIIDEFTSRDHINDILLSSVAAVNGNWEEIYNITCGVGS